MPHLVGLDGIEANADEQIRAAEEVDDDRVGRNAGADAVEQPMILGYEALGFGRDEDGHAERVHERAHATGVDVRVDVDAQNDDRTTRARDFRGDTIERVRRSQTIDRRGHCAGLAVVFVGVRNVARQRDVHWSHARRDAHGDRLADFSSGVAAVERDRELRERPVKRVQVEILVRRDATVFLASVAVIAMTGDRSRYAFATPSAMLTAPGPSVATHTPGCRRI